MIPPTLADISKTLVTINLRSNPRLDMIPKKIRGDTRLIMWVCKLHRENEMECQFVLGSIDQLEALTSVGPELGKKRRSSIEDCVISSPPPIAGRSLGGRSSPASPEQVQEEEPMVRVFLFIGKNFFFVHREEFFFSNS